MMLIIKDDVITIDFLLACTACMHIKYTFSCYNMIHNKYITGNHVVVHVHNMTSCVFGFMHLLSALMVASRTSCIANTSIRMYNEFKGACDWAYLGVN